MRNILILSLFLSSFVLADELDEYNFKNGEDIYKQTCISCHGADGKAQTNMNLVVKPRDLTKTILDHDQIYKIVRDGSHVWGSKSDIMPSFKSVYSDEDLIDVAYYVSQNFAKPRSSEVNQLLNDAKKLNNTSMKKGKKVYLRNCSLCHGLKGDGNSVYVEQSKEQDNFIYPYDLTKILLTKEQIFLYAKYGGKFWGTDKNDMPSWKKKYDDETLKSVAEFITEHIQQK